MIIEEFVQVAAPAARVSQVLADPGHMSALPPELDRIEWRGALSPDADGCRVAERFETAGWISRFYHLWGRYPMLRRGMRTTVQAIKTEAEQAAAQQQT